MSERDQKGLVRVGESPLLKAAAAPTAFDLFDPVESEVIRPEDIAYTHSIFVQCFLPLRHNEANSHEWETGNRNAKLLITAGRLINPDKPGEFRRCSVPAGPKARLVAAYINDFSFRHKTPVVNLGDSMRKFMDEVLHDPHERRRDGSKPNRIGGRNGKEIKRELENFAAAEIVLGVWSPDGASAQQEIAKVAKRMHFWIEKNPDQKNLWQQEMTLSDEYYRSLIEGQHIAPIHWPANIALQANPRAMDILNFLTYRLRKPLRKPVLLRAEVLHSMFGRDINQLKHFWPRFRQALGEALKHYPGAQVEILNDALALYDSPTLIPYRRTMYLKG